MNNFLEEKEKLLNSIENNTPNHWKEYYKDVPIDCIFDDLVIDVNEIKRLTEENQQLKEKLSFDLQWAIKYDKLHKEIRKLKEQLQQKEDIINKANKYVISHLKQDMLSDFTGANYIQEYIEEPDRLLEILDNKGE